MMRTLDVPGKNTYSDLQYLYLKNYYHFIYIRNLMLNFHIIICRLVRGDGEILEEIVSESRHKEINRTATAGDGASFQANLANKMKS